MLRHGDRKKKLFKKKQVRHDMKKHKVNLISLRIFEISNSLSCLDDDGITTLVYGCTDTKQR